MKRLALAVMLIASPLAAAADPAADQEAAQCRATALSQVELLALIERVEGQRMVAVRMFAEDQVPAHQHEILFGTPDFHNIIEWITDAVLPLCDLIAERG